MTTTTDFTITITHNETHGQIYLERSDDPDNSIRVPSSQAEDFLLDVQEYGVIYAGRYDEHCEEIWAIAERYEG